MVYLRPLTLTQALEILEPHRWDPSHYFGYSPKDSFLILSIHRESRTYEECNYAVAKKLFAEAGFPCGRYEDDQETPPPVHDWRASCSMVGWQEHMVVRDSAPEQVLILAAQILKALEDHPFLDEDKVSEAECDAAFEWWQQESLSWRVEQCQEHEVSIFAARRKDDIPGAVEQHLRELV